MNTDGIRTLASVIAIISTIFFAFGFNKDDLTIWSDYKWLRWISSIILISSFLYLLFAETLSKLWTSFIMKKRHLKGAVISKRYTQVEIMDNSGKIAHLFQKIHFEKIKNGEYITNTQCDMSVKESYIDMNMTQTANCSVEVLENRKQLCVYFKDNIEKLNKKSSLFRVDKFLYYNTVLVNSFIDRKSDNWFLATMNYCKEYDLKIIFPPERKIQEVFFYKRKENQEEKVVDVVKPIILNENGRDIIYLSITNFDNNDKYRLKWNYKKKRLLF